MKRSGEDLEMISWNSLTDPTIGGGAASCLGDEGALLCACFGNDEDESKVALLKPAVR